jgi:hypothetical protein
VQCLIVDNSVRVLCEAASGYYEAKPVNQPEMTLGPRAKALIDVADLLLKSLFDAYGVRPPMRVELIAPLAGVDHAPIKPCLPTS